MLPIALLPRLAGLGAVRGLRGCELACWGWRLGSAAAAEPARPPRSGAAWPAPAKARARVGGAGALRLAVALGGRGRLLARRRSATPAPRRRGGGRDDVREGLAGAGDVVSRVGHATLVDGPRPGAAVRGNGSKRLQHGKQDDADEQHGRHLVEHAIPGRRLRPLVALEPADMRGEDAVAGQQQNHQQQLRRAASRRSTGPATVASANPASRVTTMAGVVIALSRRRSITLKVSDVSEPTGDAANDTPAAAADRTCRPSRP